MQKFKLMLFGGFRLVKASGELVMPSARKSKALLAWLAINPDQQHPREKLAAVLWPDSDEVQGRHSLRQALGELRKIMPDDTGPLHATKDWLLLDSQQMDVDVVRFNAALARGDDASLDEVIELYKGEFLEGCNPHSDSFDEWLASYRNNYSVRASNAIEQRLASLLALQDYDRASYVAVRLLNIDPLQESAYRALMRAYAGLGNYATALRWYRRCRIVLQRELGVAPDPLTQALHDELLLGREGDEPAMIGAKPEPPKTCRRPFCKRDVSPLTAAGNPSSYRERILYWFTTAIDGILDNIGGQGFLLRGEHAAEKAELVTAMIELAGSRGFSCCRRQIPDFANAGDNTALQKFVSGSSECLLNQPVLLVVEHIHLASMDTLKLLANLIAAAGNGAILLVMTSCFEGEPLDPVWRGAMRGAPLTTIDL
jgi:DNA-binding SARP family transcriptional activator